MLNNFFNYLKDKYLNSLLRKSFNAIKKSPLLLLYIIFLDMVFLGLFYLFNYLFKKIIPDASDITRYANSQTTFIILLVILSLIYFLLIILTYSFFNLIVMGNIRKMSEKYVHRFVLFKNMFILNLLLFFIFFLFVSLLNYLGSFLIGKPVWLLYIIVIISLIVLMFIYVFYHFSNAILILNYNKLRDIIKKSFQNTISFSYWGIISFNIFVVIIYLVIYLLLTLILGDYILKNYELFVNSSSIITLILIYFLFVFNRIYFFFLSEKNIKGLKNDYRKK
ncbi:MAG: hypothetical protein KatS3mg002_0164 [Candidatus Woesearchaeota archaeon]|nr:MAG: hypothetical protein KatS3mg002_0164 [Candidatus Woesearchaeota archaeon]